MDDQLTSGEQVLLDVTFDADPSAGSILRRKARGLLGPGGAAELAELVISELVTNAQRHAPGLHQIRIIQREDHYRIEVEDSSVDDVALGPPLRENQSTNGRGLRVVQAISARFGVTSRNTGKVVWAEVAR